MSTLFENKYYNTYYYSNIVSNILSQDIELLGFISNFFADEETIYYLAKPFEKESAFHVFIKHIIIEFLENDMSEHDEKIFKYYEAGKSPLKPLYAESALKEYGLDDYNFEEFIDEKKQIDYQDVEAYHDELRLTGKIEDLCDQITKEVFYIMFNNREVLLNFNYMVAQHMNVTTNEIENDDIKRLFNKNGLLKSENSRMVQKSRSFQR
ncbi:hypothetical protein WSM22_06440 [Cytophagales bacterium WSM2-2]|nr:hypothetical protein WSM22_06440 [Cytophagales bacterium WSM2-2]